ncbi:MAG: PmoA family protein [Sedimentisphaerales bacterium]|nr:PmoA family protein [Sedimentisphaerales bacterium]
MKKLVPLLFVILVFVLPSRILSANSTTTKPIATITVEAGDYDRIDTPVCVRTNDIEFDFEKEPFVVMEVRGGNEMVIPAQYEAGKSPKVWFRLSGKTEAGTNKVFKIYPNYDSRIDWAFISVQKDDKALTLKRGDANILSYQYAVMPAPAGSSNRYDRSGFIHPLWSPEGNILTDIHPPDHIHHMGIWMPWTHTHYEGQMIDFWNVGDGSGTVRFSKFISTAQGNIFGGFQAEQEHIGLRTSKGEQVILDEIWDVRVYNNGEGLDQDYWIVDFKSTQKNITDIPLIQDEYRYGGFGFRGAREWKGANSAYLTSEGKTRADGHATTARWCDVAGVIDGKWEGVTIYSHPENYKHPEPMRIWPEPDNYVFFNFAPSQAGEWVMEPGKEYVFQYRLFVHEEKPNLEEIERVWNDYANPPNVSIETGGSSNKVVLFDGTDFSQWVSERNGPIRWEIEDGTMKITPRSGGIMTKDNYTDFKMHLEFKYPDMDANVRGQSRSNSGVYIQRRYEVQILDSYGLEPRNNDCGAIYQFKAPDKNACAKPDEWQTYDITFHAAKFEGNTKVKNARITVVQNGITIHNDVEIPNKTGAGQQEGPDPAPILLQEHSNILWFRNIWIEPL